MLRGGGGGQPAAGEGPVTGCRASAEPQCLVRKRGGRPVRVGLAPADPRRLLTMGSKPSRGAQGGSE